MTIAREQPVARSRVVGGPGFDDEMDRFGPVEELYLHHKPNGVHFARTRGAEDPEGLFDLVFADVVAKIPSLDDADDAFAAYLYRSLSNRVISEHRVRRVDPVTFDESHHESIDRAESFEDAIARSDFVDELLAHLTDAEREVVVNRYFGNLTAIETAQVLDKSPEAVRQLHRSAIRRLRFVLAATAAVVVAALAIVAIRAALNDRVSTAPADRVEDGTARSTPSTPDPPIGRTTLGPRPTAAADRDVAGRDRPLDAEPATPPSSTVPSSTVSSTRPDGVRPEVSGGEPASPVTATTTEATVTEPSVVRPAGGGDGLDGRDGQDGQAYPGPGGDEQAGEVPAAVP